jgi:large subunit ribosomal protein L7e
MAAPEEDTKLAYIPEVILKKRKSKDNNEALANLRKNQLQLGKVSALAKKRKAGEVIKRPEDFVLEFRAKELDIIQMRHRVKRAKKAVITPSSKLLFIVRIQGKNDMHPKTRKALYSLRLRKVFDGIFVRANEGVMMKLQKVEPYVTYGYPNLKNVKDLIYKKGYGLIDKQRVPLTDNNIIEQALGKHGIVCIEDIVHEISTVGAHFLDVIRFLGPFALNKPEGLQGSKKRFKDGGDTGNREDGINDLISKMN